MNTPSHWNNLNILSFLLWPFGLLYGTATALRQHFISPQKVSAKVICVGNLTAGGTGKTPVSVSIAQLLQKQNKKVCFLTRGYGGKLQDVKVCKEHTAQETGDEPQILARQAPVFINKQRYVGACRAENEHFDCIIMDDGFQNPALYKDVPLLVFDGSVGIGNGCCIPAGPLREFASLGLKRAKGIIILGEDKQNLCKKVKNLPIFKGKIVPVKPQTTNKRVIAFAGIGRPAKFYNSLQECGFELVETVDFPDHHFYSREELDKLIAAAKAKQADLFTTAKDIVKIPEELRSLFQVLEITIAWDNPQALTEFLLRN